MPGMLSRARMHFLPTGLLVAVLLLVLFVRLYLLASGGFDGLYGQDAYAYYNYAVGPLRASVLSFDAPPPFTWPPGYPYLVAFTSLVIGIKPLAGQLVSILAGLLTPIFTALLAWEVWGRQRENSWIPALAGLFVALNGQFWQSSVVVMADIASLAAATLGIWSLARYGRQHAGSQTPANVIWLLLATATLSFALLSRWAYALVALPAAGYALLILWRRRAWLHGLLALGLVLFILSPLWAPALSQLLDPDEAGPAHSTSFQLYRWHPLNAFRRTFRTADGLQSYQLPNGLYYLAAPAHRYFFTPLLALFLLPGVWFTWKQRTTAMLWLIWGWAIVVFGFLANAAWQNFRYTLAYLPPLAVVAAIGVYALIAVTGRLRPLVLAALAVGFIWMSWGGWTLTGSFIDRKNVDLARMQWVENETEDNARLLTFNQTLTFQQYSDLETYELFYQTPADMERLVADGAPLWLLIDTTNVETQWLGKTPSENFRWLRDGPGLLELGRMSGYTLYQVSKQP